MPEREKPTRGRQALLALLVSAVLAAGGCAEATGPGAVPPKAKDRASYQQQEEKKKEDEAAQAVSSGRAGSGGWYWFSRTPARTGPAETAPGKGAPGPPRGSSLGSSAAGRGGSAG